MWIRGSSATTSLSEKKTYNKVFIRFTGMAFTVLKPSIKFEHQENTGELKRILSFKEGLNPMFLNQKLTSSQSSALQGLLDQNVFKLKF